MVTKVIAKENLLFSVQNGAEYLSTCPPVICELNKSLGLRGLLLFIFQWEP